MSAPSERRSAVKSASPSRSSCCHLPRLAGRRLVPGNSGDVVLGRRHILPAHPAHRGVSAAPKTKPFPVGPVFQVVTGAPARTRDVRDFVLLISRCLEPLHRRRIHHGHVVVGRLRPGRSRHLLSERRVWVNLQHVKRQVIGRQLDRFVYRLEPFADPLAGKPHHQIEADVLKTGGAGFAIRGFRPVRSMQPREPPQLIVTKRLDTETDTIDPCLPEGTKRVGRNRFGIGLQGHFAVGGDVERLVTRANDRRDFLGREERRRSPAEVNGVGSRAGPSAPPSLAPGSSRASARPRRSASGAKAGSPALSISAISARTYRALTSVSRRPRLKLQ